MDTLLSMPTNLRTPMITALVAAKKNGAIAEFCSAYESHLKVPSRAMRELLTQAAGGDQGAVEKLWIKFLDTATKLGPITDNDVETILAQARAADSEHLRDVATNLYDHLEQQVNRYIKTKLIGMTPSQWDEWDDLVNNIGGAAERIWRDVFLNDQVGALEDVTQTSQLLMVLWLEASLYRERCYLNLVARGLREDTSAHESVGRLIRSMLGSYRAIIQDWESELAEFANKRSPDRQPRTYFSDRSLQLQQLRRLIRQFSEPNPRELGWASQAASVQNELRYQLRDEIRRERFASGHPLASLGLFILKITTGYGTRPVYFAYTALVLFLSDGVAFFLNDYFNAWLNRTTAACAASQIQIHQWTDVVSLVQHYAYIAVTTLTSLGADTTLAGYCGGAYTQLLLTLSTIAGYFMLALLSAVLYSQLTQRD